MTSRDQAPPRVAGPDLTGHTTALAETLFDRMPMAVAVFDPELRLVRCNPTWVDAVERYGALPAEAVVPGAHFCSFFPGTERWADASFGRVLAGGIDRHTGTRLDVDGVVSYWDIVLSPLWEDGRVVGVLDVTTDVTEREQASAELRRRDEILSAVGAAAQRFLASGRSWRDSIDEVLGLFGRATRASRVYLFQNHRSPDGRLLASQRHEWVAEGVVPQIDNPALAGLDYIGFGWSRWIEVLGSGQVIHGRVKDLPAPERPVLEGGGILSIALVPVFVAGEWWGVIGFDERRRPRLWSATIIEALQAAASTIGAALEREQAEAELREREEQYRRVFDASGDGLVISDMDGRLVDANPAFCRMHGYTLEELVGRPATMWTHPDYHELRDVYVETIRLGGRFQTRALNVRKDGVAFPVEVHGAPFTWRGRPHTLGVVRDDTERAAAFARLEQRIAGLARVAASLTIDQTLEATLEAVAAAVVDAGAAVACSIQLVDPATGDLDTIACHALPDGYADALRRSWRAGVASPTRRALEHQRLIVVHDARRLGLDNPDYAPLHPMLETQPWNTIVVVPFDALGRSVGALNAYYVEEADVADDELTFLRSVAHQGAMVAENTRLLAEAQAKASLEERQRLARELHDSVSQALYGIALGARTARTLAERDPAKLLEPLDYVLNLAEAALAEMRSLIFELRPETLATEGLVAALERQITALRARHEATVHADLGREPDLPIAAKEALYRIAQEALNNTIKHARAQTIEVRLVQSPGEVVLEVADDGVGFDPDAPHPGHLGLHTMRERATAAGGVLEVASRPGEGAVTRARLPA